MATISQLKQAFLSVVGGPVAQAALQLNSNTRERAFEAFVFALAIKAVRQAGGTASLQGINSGANPNPVVLRGAPGNLASTAQDFAYSSCQLGSREFEIHLDVKYVGTSGAIHEADVSIVDRTEADTVRQRHGAQPGTRRLRAVFECKSYDSSLETNLGRAFVGLIDDLGRLEARAFVTNGLHAGLTAYFSKSSRPNRFFEVSPAIAGPADRFVRTLEQVLREWAQVA